MPVIGATELQPVNVLGSYVQGLEMGRSNQLAQAQAQRQALQDKMAQEKAQREARLTEEEILSKQLSRKEAKSRMENAELDRQIKNAQTIGDMLGVAQNQQAWTQLRAQAESAGLDVSTVPERFDPLYRDTMREGFLGYGKYLENQRAQATLKVQQGQLQQSRERLTFDKDREKWQRENPDYEIKDTAQGLLAINKRTGAVKPIIHNGAVVSGSAKSPDARVDEQNTAFNANRLLNSANRIVNVLNRNAGAGSAGITEAVSKSLPFVGEGLAAVVRSEDRQIIEQNYEGIVDALLFLATGAAYNKEQREATINEIKPLFTDKPAARQDKQGKLLEYIAAARIKSGRAWTPELQQALDRVVELYSPKGEARQSIGNAPEGIEPDVWAVMTPEERSLWK